jgi:selenophosphate synthase
MVASGTAAVIEAGRIDFLPGAVELVTSGVVPGGTLSNMDYTAPSVRYDEDVPEIKRVLLNDAQTSGGLLISLPETKAEALADSLTKRGVEGARVIGRVVAGDGPKITVTG